MPPCTSALCPRALLVAPVLLLLANLIPNGPGRVVLPQGGGRLEGEDSRRLGQTVESGAVALPETVGWDPKALVHVRSLFAADAGVPPPHWAKEARSVLLRSADKVKALPAGLRGMPAGPWSPTQKDLVPPSGDKRDIMTFPTYAWPCTTSCAETGFDAAKCAKWDNDVRTFGPCDPATGEPWVLRDGFSNPSGLSDLNLIVNMIESLEKLTLAWWFSPEGDGRGQAYAAAAMRVFRAWFVDEATRMTPRIIYGSYTPGVNTGHFRGVMLGAFRLNSALPDCVALLRQAGPSVWTQEDEVQWREWASAWLEFLETHEFPRKELQTKNNHATYLMLHKIAIARALGNASVALPLLAKLRVGLPASLVQQILPTGEMPHETARPLGATYSRMNLGALFKLGAVAKSACAVWACEPGWDWDWEAPAVPHRRVWKEMAGKKSKCGHLGLGSTESLGACKQSCVEDGGCTAINARFKNGVLKSCGLRSCKGGDLKLVDGTLKLPSTSSTYVWELVPEVQWGVVEGNQYSKCAHVAKGSSESVAACKKSCEEQAPCDTINARVKNGNFMDCSLKACGGDELKLRDGTLKPPNVYTVHHMKVPPEPRSGSVRRALDYLLRYAPGGDLDGRWLADHPGTQAGDAAGSWKDLAPLLRQAASVFKAGSVAGYEARIPDVDADWEAKRFNLLHPPA